MVKQQSRSYVVSVSSFSSGDFVEYEVFPAEVAPLVAKKDALKKAKSFAKQYSDDGNLYLFVAVHVDDEPLLYLNQNGEEDTKQFDWIDYYFNL
ncbi:hypothetical protein MH215_10145 [Paenibacillus sp. ACRSA]|uniref:hypothetical protein n=1 Tax=Paenibacillus sp. ACRSA TaxID=2918211 RepID=UPI001EF6BDEA|nr:hypothetical protein [Paenibacillus sp. ACRSA]MCG7377356.1 hypothetical protein [Paenibacillus sp. ACRSA]